MIARIKQHTISFKHAFEGLGYSLSSQPNFQVHLLAAIMVVCLGFYLNITSSDWIILGLTIGMVLIAELLNTAIESVVDLITKEKRVEAKIAKDVAAGMVLLAAITSVIIGFMVFGKYF